MSCLCSRRAGLLPFGVCGLPLVLVVGDEVEAGPVLVDFVSERCLGEEARLVLVYTLHVETLRVHVVCGIFCVYPRAFNDARASIAILVHVVDLVSFTVCDCDGGTVCERDVVPLGVWFAGESLSDEMLVEERLVRPVPVGAQLVNRFVVVHGCCFLFVFFVCSRATCSPLGVERRVSCADGGTVAGFEEEGGALVGVRRVFAADFCDLFGSQVALSERPQGDCSFNLRGAHAVGVGELARGFDPRADDAAAVVLLVVLVVAVGEVVSINGECLVVGGSGGTSWEDGRSVDGNMCAVGEGNGVAGRAGGVRVGDLLACEQCVEVSGAFLRGVTVNDVEHVCFLLRGRVFLSGSIVACFGIVCMVCRYLVERALGVFVIMLVARVRACGRVVVRCWGSETA